MAREVIDMQLTANEQSLLLRYGYPFDQIREALEACASNADIEIVPMDSFELERLIGDVSISINQMKGAEPSRASCWVCVSVSNMPNKPATACWKHSDRQRPLNSNANLAQLPPKSSRCRPAGRTHSTARSNSEAMLRCQWNKGEATEGVSDGLEFCQE